MQDTQIDSRMADAALKCWIKAAGCNPQWCQIPPLAQIILAVYFVVGCVYGSLQMMEDALNHGGLCLDGVGESSLYRAMLQTS